MHKNTSEIFDSFAPYDAYSPDNPAHNILLCSPHSGQYYPKQFLDMAKLNKAELRHFEDTYVNELINFSYEMNISTICANYARSYIDLNRDTESLDPLLFANFKNPKPCNNTKLGFGVIPRNITFESQIYASKIDISDGMARIKNIHEPYHNAIATEINRLKEHFGNAILIDCHSMPQKAIGKEKVDIIIGDRFGSAISQLYSDNLAAILRKNGLLVRRNYIYSGGYTTKTYGNPAANIHAIQIEINRSLYIDEKTLEKTEGFEQLQGKLKNIIEEFAKTRI